MRISSRRSTVNGLVTIGKFSVVHIFYMLYNSSSNRLRDTTPMWQHPPHSIIERTVNETDSFGQHPEIVTDSHWSASSSDNKSCMFFCLIHTSSALKLLDDTTVRTVLRALGGCGQGHLMTLRDPTADITNYHII